MIMRAILHGIFLILFMIIQATWIDTISVFGVKPNLFAVYIVVTSCFCQKNESVVTGFVFGFILDILIGKVLGVNAVLLMLLGFFTAYFCEKVIRKNNVFIVMLITLIITFIYELFYYIIAFLGDLQFKEAFVGTLLPECVYNGIAAMPIYFLIKKVSGKLWDNSEER